MILLENNNCISEWSDEDQILVFTHKGFVQGEVLRANGLQMYNTIKEKQGSKLLLNTLEMKVLDPEDQQWINQELIPQMLAIGLLYVAILIPKSVLAAMSLKTVVKQTGESKEGIAYFSSREEAEEWLRSK